MPTRGRKEAEARSEELPVDHDEHGEGVPAPPERERAGSSAPRVPRWRIPTDPPAV